MRSRQEPSPLAGLRHKGLLWEGEGRGKGSLRRNAVGGVILSTLLMGQGSAEAWVGLKGSLYLLPIGVPQNVAAHDVDDVWLWVHFAHQAAQPLPEAGEGGARHRWSPTQAPRHEQRRPRARDRSLLVRGLWGWVQRTLPPAPAPPSQHQGPPRPLTGSCLLPSPLWRRWPPCS